MTKGLLTIIYAYKKKNMAVTGTGRFHDQVESSWAKWPAKVLPGTLSNEELRELNQRCACGSDQAKR